MRIILQVSDRHGFTWQDELADRLRAADHQVLFASVADAPPWPSLVDRVASIERLVLRYRGPELLALRRPASTCPAEVFCDLTLDLSGRDEPTDGAIRPLYDGSADPRAALSGLLDGRVPLLSVVDGRRVLATGLPANERPDLLAAGLDFVFARGIDLLVNAVGAHGRDAAPDATLEPTRPIGWRPAVFTLAALRSKLSARLTRMLADPPAWRVGFRPVQGAPIRQSGLVPEGGFAWLPQDAGRFFADSFLFEHDGQLWCFVEEFPFATGIGIISVVPVGADGHPLGKPRPVLETGSHLSYPCVFASAGDIWMIPESCAAGRVSLYRSVEFPWRWREHRVLVEGLVSDATPVQHGDRLWLFGTVQSRSAEGATLGSSWDALGLWSAPDLDGEFIAHPGNPVLVDAGAARPAGRFWRRGGDLMRVAQDCRGRYGAGLAFCRVDRLDPDGFAQTVECRATAPEAWQAAGLHTLDTAGGIEAIDCFRSAPP